MSIYEKIKEQIKTDFFQQNFPNDGQRFVAWYLRKIHFREGAALLERHLSII